ncbi:Uu.00g050040.m01.CDS01 [Anthostomella pinea]|uniref:Adenylosuccinate synthetase n=1 Tax=Anthostomella pinea TaxID=933095 RepID=A0AAI8VSI1_9PEZI|nr:Uu.00g050040.m01.CDS01 [Anthostomella pinea]
MPATIILGSQWGDEGKGKLTDILGTPKTPGSGPKLVARAAGGHLPMAYPTTSTSYLYVLRNSIPTRFPASGLVNPSCVNLIGSGVVFHVPSFWKELDALEAKGLSGVRERILVSDRCQVNLDLHAAVDGLEEVELGERKIGTTGRGIGPSYSTKAARSGIRIHEVFDQENFERKLRQMASGYKKRFGDLLKYDVENEINRFREYRPKLAEYVVDAVHYMKNAQDRDWKILIEGANALMLDIDYGTYPYVTSSNTGLGGIFTGLALHPKKIEQIIGVAKAYTTRVGGGPFKTEDLGEDGTKLQEIGREWGVSTGRKRRCGWLDLVVLQYSNSINQYTCWNLTKLDCLDTFKTIKVATAYKHPKSGEEIGFPADLVLLERCEVVYQELEGWQQPTTHTKTFEGLPQRAREYVELIEKHTGVPVAFIGTGPDREDMITRPLPAA